MHLRLFPNDRQWYAFILVLFICQWTPDQVFAQPDLIVVESALVNSLSAQTLNNNDNCYVDEGCVSGLGLRQILRFTTHIKNIGNQDFYVGQPPANPQDANEVWEWDACHGHWHYEGYAEYLLFDENDNQIPIGFKNGFCLIDVECSGGGTFTYTCNNQGIAAGCGDIYGSGLDCQWIDVTDVDPGLYKMIIRVNWDGDPDALGNFESSYDNNTGAVCFELNKDEFGTASINVLGNGTSCSNSGTCSDVTLNLALDQYPAETSWEIKNAFNQVVVSSLGTYANEPSGTVINQTFCLEEGCYDFIINDVYGDGICCDYGNGSFNLYDGSGNVLVSGSTFTDADTTNFCVGPPGNCLDIDNDGICEEQDCDDTNPAVPAPPGAACNDGNPNTIGDEIQTDGCTCAGYAIGDCDAIHVHAIGNAITIEHITGFPHLNILLFDANWQTYDSCLDDCDDPHIFSNLPAGTWHVSVKPMDESWLTICNPIFTVVTSNGPCTDADGDGYCFGSDCDDNDPSLPTLIGTPCDDGNPDTSNDIIQSDGCTCLGSLPCTDADNDGFCLDEDCDDNDPSLPTTAGTACDDGDPNTDNDVILSDGCTCEGMPATGCMVDFVVGPNSITVTGLGHPNVSVQVFDATWTFVHNCLNTCNNPEEVTGLPEGTYFVKVTQWNAGWEVVCEETAYVNVTGGCQEGQPCDDGEPCTENDAYDADCNCVGTAAPDGDNDGVCSVLDCDDADPLLPTAAGTACDDGDAQTENDVYLADGCTCAGVAPSGCSAQAVVSGSSIVVSGLNDPNVAVKLFEAVNWSTISECFNDCTNPIQIDNLPDGVYYINIQTWDGGWQPVCTVGEYLTIGGGEGLAAEIEKSHLFFLAVANGRSVHLNWTTNSEHRNDHFIIERSKDGKNFTPIQTLESMHNREGIFSYQANDHEPFGGINYYRLKVIHYDESFLLSDIHEISMATNWQDFTIFPNPTTGYMLINLPKYEGSSGILRIVDQVGRTVYEQKLDKISKKAVKLNIQHLQDGFYNLIIKLDGHKQLYKKFVKIN